MNNENPDHASTSVTKPCHPTKKPSQSLRSTRITRSSGKKSLFLAKLWRERKEVGFSCLVGLSVSFCVLGVPTNYLFKPFFRGKVNQRKWYMESWFAFLFLRRRMICTLSSLQWVLRLQSQWEHGKRICISMLCINNSRIFSCAEEYTGLVALKNHDKSFLFNF